MTAYEYENDPKLREAAYLHVYRNSNGTSEFEPSFPIIKYSIRCGEQNISPNNLLVAASVYRSVQFESTSKEELPQTSTIVDGKIYNHTSPLQPSDVLRAVIALMTAKQNTCPGETFEYTTCGVYNLVCIIPFSIVFVVLLALMFATRFVAKSSDIRISLPTCSAAWFNHMAREGEGKAAVDPKRRFDVDFVLLPDNTVALSAELNDDKSNAGSALGT